MADEKQLPPPQWFPDPHDPNRWRWWDGARWTDQYAPREGSGTANGAASSDEAPHKKRSRFARELVGNKQERAEAKAERLAARADVTATYKARVREIEARSEVRRGGRTTGTGGDSPALSHQGSMPTIAQLLSELDLEAPRHPLDEQVEVAGETYHIAGIKKVFRGRGLPISARGTEITEAACVLVPEPWNPSDSNAVAVAIEGHQVGHLPADLACDYAHSLAALANNGLLATGRARIWAKDDGGGVVRARITILIPEASEF